MGAVLPDVTGSSDRARYLMIAIIITTFITMIGWDNARDDAWMGKRADLACTALDRQLWVFLGSCDKLKGRRDQQACRWLRRQHLGQQDLDRLCPEYSALQSSPWQDWVEGSRRLASGKPGYNGELTAPHEDKKKPKLCVQNDPFTILVFKSTATRPKPPAWDEVDLNSELRRVRQKLSDPTKPAADSSLQPCGRTGPSADASLPRRFTILSPGSTPESHCMTASNRLWRRWRGQQLAFAVVDRELTIRHLSWRKEVIERKVERQAAQHLNTMDGVAELLVKMFATRAGSSVGRARD